MSICWWLCLATAIWVIYTADHLVDAIKISAPLDGRRMFYHRHFKMLLLVVVVLSIIVSILGLTFLSSKIIVFGVAIGLISALYLSLVFFFGQKKKVWLQKELYVSVIYTIGIWGSIILMSLKTLNLEELLIILSFFMLVFSDILIFSIYDHRQDVINQFVSLIELLGINKVARLIITLLIASCSLSIALLFFSEPKFKVTGAILLLMAIVLSWIFIGKDKLANNEWYRYIGETVFFLPALILFY